MTDCKDPGDQNMNFVEARRMPTYRDFRSEPEQRELKRRPMQHRKQSGEVCNKAGNKSTRQQQVMCKTWCSDSMDLVHNDPGGI